MDSVFLVKGHGMVATWESMAHLHSAIRALHAIVEEMKYDIKAMSAKIDEMQEEWREEYEPDDGSSDDSMEGEWDEDEVSSVASAPASFQPSGWVDAGD